MNAARTECEKVIHADRAYNISHNILRTNVFVADRLLHRGLELEQAYDELWSQLQAVPRALPVFFDALLNTAAHWSPEKLREARDARSELREVNARIVEAAEVLAELLRRRTELQDAHGFTTGAHYHVCDLIEAASARNGLFQSWLQKPLEQLRGQFDLKYWPSLPAIIEQVAVDARDAQPRALDPVTAAGTAASRASLADFFKALFVAIEENGMREYGPLPHGFKLTDASYAALANCALNLDPDRCVDGPYVKRLRQGIRDDEARQQSA